MKKSMFFSLAVVLTSICLISSSKLMDKEKDVAASQKAEVEKIKVALWDYDITGYDKKLIEQFTSRNPNIQVEVVSIPNPYYDEKLKIMLAEDEDIDVFLQGALDTNKLPLNNLIVRDNINMAAYGNYVKTISNSDGVIYGIPYRKDWMVLYYNKDIFERNNIPYPTNEMTLEDYATLAKYISMKVKSNEEHGIFAMPYLYYNLTNMLYDQSDFSPVKSNFSDLKPALQLFMDIQLSEKSASDYASNRSISVDQRVFEKGSSAMFINGTWFINYLINDKMDGKFNFDWGIVKLPYWDGGEHSTSTIYTTVSINKKTKNLEAAWSFVKFITGKEGATILAQEMLLPGYMDEEVKTVFNNNPSLPKGSEEGLKYNKEILYNQLNEKYGAPPILVREIMSMIYEEVQMVITRNKSVDQGIEDMEKRRQEILDRYN